MALSTFAELKTSIAAWLNRDDLTAQIPDFVALFEADFDADVRTALHRRRICRSEATIENEYESLPANYLAVQSFVVDGEPVWRLEYVSPEELANRKQTQDAWRTAVELDWTKAAGEGSAPPKYFSIVGTEARFLPVPTASYDALLTIYERLAKLTLDADSNWLLATYPQAYLFGSLLQASLFLTGDPRLATWQSLYDLAIQKIQTSDPTPADPNVIRADTPPLRMATSADTFRP